MYDRSRYLDLHPSNLASFAKLANMLPQSISVDALNSQIPLHPADNVRRSFHYLPALAKMIDHLSYGTFKLPILPTPKSTIIMDVETQTNIVHTIDSNTQTEVLLAPEMNGVDDKEGETMIID